LNVLYWVSTNDTQVNVNSWCFPLNVDVSWVDCFSGSCLFEDNTAFVSFSIWHMVSFS
jgi:hypothetical protein